jgi:hypothetical protein
MKAEDKYVDCPSYLQACVCKYIFSTANYSQGAQKFKCGFTWDFQNNEKTMEHFDHWIVTGWHGEQRDFQNNEKTMKHSDHWIMTGWHGEQ